MRQRPILLTAAGLVLAGALWLRTRPLGLLPVPAPPTTAPEAMPTGGVDDRLDPAMFHVFLSPPASGQAAAESDTAAQVQLGRRLFFDKRLSRNHDLSCNSCHGLSTYGADGQRVSPGHKRQLGRRNSPTVFHAGEHVAQFWDGRAATLEEQAQGPMLNPVEMAMPSGERVVETLRSMPGYVRLFQEAFPEQAKPVSVENAARAIAAFERKLVTRSRFDAYLGGDETALTRAEARGLKRFATAGCTACHNGPAVGGTSLQKLGLIEPYPNTEDLGRFELTRHEEDRMKFRVPTLRNVARTGPYFHDGSVPELAAAVRLMGKHQLGLQFTEAEVRDLVAFLESLTGELPEALIEPPELPASTSRTPKPDPS